MAKPLSNEKRAKILKLVDKLSPEKIAEKFNVHVRTVGRILARMEKNDGNADLLAMGGDRKSLENESELIEFVKEKIKSGVKDTSEFISKSWKKWCGVDRTDGAVRAILKKNGIQLSDEQVTRAGKSGKVKAVKKKVSSGKQKLAEMRNFLSKEEIAALNAIIKKRSVNDRIKNLCRAILALNRGEGFQSVMNFLQVSRQTVRTWLRNYLKGGLERLTYWGYAGMRNHCKTTLKQERRITAYIRENPTISLRKLRRGYLMILGYPEANQACISWLKDWGSGAGNPNCCQGCPRLPLKRHGLPISIA